MSILTNKLQRRNEKEVNLLTCRCISGECQVSVTRASSQCRRLECAAIPQNLGRGCHFNLVRRDNMLMIFG